MHRVECSTQIIPGGHFWLAHPRIFPYYLSYNEMSSIPLTDTGRQARRGLQGSLTHWTTFKVAQKVPGGQNLSIQAEISYMIIEIRMLLSNFINIIPQNLLFHILISESLLLKSILFMKLTFSFLSGCKKRKNRK